MPVPVVNAKVGANVYPLPLLVILILLTEPVAFSATVATAIVYGLVVTSVG